MLKHRVVQKIRGKTVCAVFLSIAALFAAVAATPARADWKKDCNKDIERAMANLTVVWQHLNARQQIIGEGPHYIYELEDSKRCAAIWKERIKSFQEDGTFVWWSRSAVNICEAGHRMSVQNLLVATDTEVIGFWRRRQWRYQHCITAGQRIVIGMEN